MFLKFLDTRREAAGLGCCRNSAPRPQKQQDHFAKATENVAAKSSFFQSGGAIDSDGAQHRSQRRNQKGLSYAVVEAEDPGRDLDLKDTLDCQPQKQTKQLLEALRENIRDCSPVKRGQRWQSFQDDEVIDVDEEFENEGSDYTDSDEDDDVEEISSAESSDEVTPGEVASLTECLIKVARNRRSVNVLATHEVPPISDRPQRNLPSTRSGLLGFLAGARNTRKSIVLQHSPAVSLVKASSASPAASSNQQPHEPPDSPPVTPPRKKSEEESLSTVTPTPAPKRSSRLRQKTPLLTPLKASGTGISTECQPRQQRQQRQPQQKQQQRQRQQLEQQQQQHHRRRQQQQQQQRQQQQQQQQPRVADQLGTQTTGRQKQLHCPDDDVAAEEEAAADAAAEAAALQAAPAADDAAALQAAEEEMEVEASAAEEDSKIKAADAMATPAASIIAASTAPETTTTATEATTTTRAATPTAAATATAANAPQKTNSDDTNDFLCTPLEDALTTAEEWGSSNWLDLPGGEGLDDEEEAEDLRDHLAKRRKKLQTKLFGNSSSEKRRRKASSWRDSWPHGPDNCQVKSEVYSKLVKSEATGSAKLIKSEGIKREKCNQPTTAKSLRRDIDDAAAGDDGVARNDGVGIGDSNNNNNNNSNNNGGTSLQREKRSAANRTAAHNASHDLSSSTARKAGNRSNSNSNNNSDNNSNKNSNKNSNNSSNDSSSNSDSSIRDENNTVHGRDIFADAFGEDVGSSSSSSSNNKRISSDKSNHNNNTTTTNNNNNNSNSNCNNNCYNNNSNNNNNNNSDNSSSNNVGNSVNCSSRRAELEPSSGTPVAAGSAAPSTPRTPGTPGTPGTGLLKRKRQSLGSSLLDGRTSDLESGDGQSEDQSPADSGRSSVGRTLHGLPRPELLRLAGQLERRFLTPEL